MISVSAICCLYTCPCSNPLPSWPCLTRPILPVQVLSGRGREEMLSDLHAYLTDLAARVRAGQVGHGRTLKR